jgi:hypothetical protein
MKVSTTFLALLLSSLVAAEGLSFNLFSDQKPLAGERVAVPGDSPLTYCKGEHDDDLLVIDHINLDPNPPAKCVSFPLLYLRHVHNLLNVHTQLTFRLQRPESHSRSSRYLPGRRQRGRVRYSASQVRPDQTRQYGDRSL